jgi:hypothetical protein
MCLEAADGRNMDEAAGRNRMAKKLAEACQKVKNGRPQIRIPEVGRNLSDLRHVIECHKDR